MIPEKIQIHINEFSRERYPENAQKRLAHIQGMETMYMFLQPDAEGWIKVENGLPEIKDGEDNSENVFAILNGRPRIMAYCYIDEGYCDVDEKYLGGWAWCDCGMQIDGDPEFDDDYKPTHWQPIPKLPNPPQNKGE